MQELKAGQAVGKHSERPAAHLLQTTSQVQAVLHFAVVEAT